MVLEENYEFFKRFLGFDFDPLQVVLEFMDDNSKFWDTLQSSGPEKCSHLWGILFGYGKENSLAFLWKYRHLKSEKSFNREILFSKTLDKASSNHGCFSIRNDLLFDITHLPIPSFSSFAKDDPVVKRYDVERRNIQEKYKNKDFVYGIIDSLSL